MNKFMCFMADDGNGTADDDFDIVDIDAEEIADDDFDYRELDDSNDETVDADEDEEKPADFMEFPAEMKVQTEKTSEGQTSDSEGQTVSAEKSDSTGQDISAEKSDSTGQDDSAEKSDSTGQDDSAEKSDSTGQVVPEGKADSAETEKKKFSDALAATGAFFKKNGIKILIILAAVFGVAYIAGALYYSKHFLPNTSINGRNVANETPVQVENEIKNDAEGYVLTITGRNGLTDTIKASDIDLEPVFDGSTGKLLKSQNAFDWVRAALGGDVALTSGSTVSYNATVLKEKVDGLVFFNIENVVQPVNASYSYNSGIGQYEVTAENNGSAPLRYKTLAAVENSINGLTDTMDMDAEGCYAEAYVRSDSETIAETVSELNKAMTADLKFEFGDETEELTSDVFHEWFSYGSMDGVKLNAAKVTEWVADLAGKHDTYNKERKFHTSTNEEVTVPAGSFGWEMDQVETAKLIVEDISKGYKGTVEPVWTSKGEEFGDDDWGDTYVEVDLDNQHVWCYVDGLCVIETPCVTGNVAHVTGTPDGIYDITFKETNATLVGEGYQSHVNYWMPFNRGIGLHDATWRSKFGGGIYLTSGSHGCVNLPLSAAKTIYANIEKGEPVIVHTGTGVLDVDKVGKKADKGAGRVTDDGFDGGGSTVVETPADDSSSADSASQATGSDVTSLTNAAQSAQAAAVAAAQAAAADPGNADLAAKA
ncbi:MAG: L,D-transpeptidase family protein, partial [Clostridiales bacterium]|nr:L,D-transpeptidase family protein [Clostridiales bacterium]